MTGATRHKRENTPGRFRAKRLARRAALAHLSILINSMRWRSLFLAVALLSGVIPQLAKAAINPLISRYQGRYYFVVLNNQNANFQFGGSFLVATTGVVSGVYVDGNNHRRTISNVITTRGRFSFNVISGANIVTINIGISSTAALIGSTQMTGNPGSMPPNPQYSIIGRKFDPFFIQSGLYSGVTNDKRSFSFVLTLNKGVFGTFEQTPGAFVPMYGGASLVTFSARSYKATTRFRANYTSTGRASGTWTQMASGVVTTGTFSAHRIG
jgi:hypothetical protein